MVSKGGRKASEHNGGGRKGPERAGFICSTNGKGFLVPVGIGEKKCKRELAQLSPFYGICNLPS